MRERRSRLRGCAVALVVVVGVLGLVLFVGRASFRKVGEARLAAVTSRLDADEPGWRLEAIEAARAASAPPPDENPAAVALAQHRRLPAGWWNLLSSESGIGGGMSNTHPGFWQLVTLIEAVAGAGDVPAATREGLLRPAVLARPNGYIRVEHKDNPFATILPDVQNLRAVFAVLEADARLAVLSGDPDRAVRDARAILVAARGIGDEPFLISQLVRWAGANVAARTALQVLAWGEPAEGLAELQADLLAEAAHPAYLIGLRGERAMLDKFFEGLEAGKVGVTDLKNLELLGGGRMPPDVVLEAGFRLYQGFLPGDRAECLRLFGELIAAARRPLPEQAAAVSAVQLPPKPPESYRYLITSMVLPSAERIHASYLRTRTDLRTAAVAVACERFRRKSGRWPGKLEEIPKDILSERPADPATGGPLGYERTEDGVVVFGAKDAVERSRPPDGNELLGGRGRGWRLWDPAARGKTPPAPDVEFVPDMPTEGDGP